MAYATEKTEELLKIAAAHCYQNRMSQPQPSSAHTAFSSILDEMTNGDGNSDDLKVSVFSSFAPSIQKALDSMRIDTMSVLSSEGSNAIVLRGFGPDYPNGCVIRAVSSRTEAKGIDDSIVLQPYASCFIDHEGKVIEDPIVKLKENPGIRIELLPEIVSIESAAKWLVKNSHLDQEDLKAFKAESYKIFYANIPPDCVNLDHNIDNSCVLPDGSVITHDRGSIIKNPKQKQIDNMLENVQSQFNQDLQAIRDQYGRNDIGNTLTVAQEKLRKMQTAQGVQSQNPRPPQLPPTP